MKGILGTIAFATSIIAVSFASLANAGEVLDKILAAKTLTVAVSPNYPPNSFLNDKGELVGFDVDIGRLVAERIGVGVKYETPAWDIITSGRWQGRWDIVVAAMAPTKDRAKIFNFPATYEYTVIVAAVHKDSKATKVQDLDGKLVGALAGSMSYDYVSQNFKKDELIGVPNFDYQFKPGQIKPYETSNNGLDDLRIGDGKRLDAFVSEDSVILDAIKAGYPIKQLGSGLMYGPAVIATLPGDAELDQKITEAIKGLRESGKLSELSMKWFGRDVTTAKQQ
ncbi:transporter substrate-binding domain-containing protein [Aminobacter anthyllidis]|uniref:Transporter substrate-binding domain-containing protein n=1 Tax=Aminobacter anthyllidis TaxID=1035067 RepID=A0A9X1AH45_9HYPH|nr:transporter substrate-binding domain-containing protein [Aminobacter anthyllidis]MBT1159880.1 transporter substrate-binding domain-containing protein [Aminobacter anthyllidis]